MEIQTMNGFMIPFILANRGKSVPSNGNAGFSTDAALTHALLNHKKQK